MSELQIFTNDEFGQIRTLDIDGEPWFVGKDVAEALGYNNPQKALRDHIDQEDRTVNEMFTVNGTAPILISESGLYALIFGSKLPSAKKFKRWVTSEVLPTLRKCGVYIVENTAVEYITPRERLSLAKLIASAPRDRLPAVKKIVQPLIGEDLDKLIPISLPNTVVSEDEVIRRTWQLMEQYGIEKDNDVFVNINTFNDAFADMGSRTARKILDIKGLLVRDNADINVGTRSCRRYINGKRKRCIAIKKRLKENFENERIK